MIFKKKIHSFLMMDFYCGIFNYMFRPVILTSSGRQFSYNDGV